ncbi:MAG: hypothetical protein K2F83_02565, partial [Oscillospiraceae bacterium]|nr:hypothetical protein [Oscillospiraceae bacterium]
PTAPPDPNGVYDADTGMGWALYHQVTTDSNVNLDLNDYAFFAIMGEEFKDPGLRWAKDSSGRPVDLTKAILSLSVYTLDNGTGVDKDSPYNQLTRFALPDVSVAGVPSGDDTANVKARTVTIDFVDKNDGTPASSSDTVTANWATWYIADDKLTQTAEDDSTLVEFRPGRYRLVYTFPDYNYIAGDPDYENNFLMVYRDFVVLAPVGDVNADLATNVDGTTYTTDVDETLVEGRISPNAGYPALGYMADYYDYSAIFKLRTCDVNNDRNINNIDANTILRNTGVARFYLPVDYIK